MVVLAYAALFPGAAQNLISISGTAAARFAIALRSIQREAILRDPDFKAGQYTDARPPETGMRIARKLGMMTYRSAAEWVERFGRTPATPEMRDDSPFGPEFAVQSYLELHARRFVRAFDPNCYLYLSRAMDRFDLSQHGESVPLVLKRSGVERALIIGVESDMLFSIAEQASLAQAFTTAGVDTHYAPLDCIEGHDSFLIDIKRFGREISGFWRSRLKPSVQDRHRAMRQRLQVVRKAPALCLSMPSLATVRTVPRSVSASPAAAAGQARLRPRPCAAPNPHTLNRQDIRSAPRRCRPA